MSGNFCIARLSCFKKSIWKRRVVHVFRLYNSFNHTARYKESLFYFQTYPRPEGSVVSGSELFENVKRIFEILQKLVKIPLIKFCDGPKSSYGNSPLFHFRVKRD